MTRLPLPTELCDFVDEQTPAARNVWRFFNDIEHIPRATDNEAEVRDYILRYAARNQLATKIDKAGNVVVYVPAHAPAIDDKKITTCLQSHLDIVAAKEKGSSFDFSKEPIQLGFQDGWVHAKGTSLGADNGIGVAIMLAIAADPDVKHGPLELLFTVREEDGCKGAKALDIPLQAKYLINLDSEDGPVIFNGCAGSITQTSRLVVPRDTLECDHRYILEVSGLPGGHSGLDIHEKQRGNAFTIAGRVLNIVQQAYPDSFRIIDVTGDKEQARNKIPNTATASFVLHNGAIIESIVTPMLREFMRPETPNYRGLDVNMTKETVIFGRRDYSAFSRKISRGIVCLMRSDHSGVYAWDAAGRVPSLSSNLGVMQTGSEGIDIVYMVRSDRTRDMEAHHERMNQVCGRYGFKPVPLTPEDRMEPWEPVDSALVLLAAEVGRAIYHVELPVRTIHAGLEAGIIKDKNPGIHSAISIGPKIEHPHSVDERVDVRSVGKTYQLLSGMLERL
jgi:dipeptidase D